MHLSKPMEVFICLVSILGYELRPFAQNLSLKVPWINSRLFLFLFLFLDLVFFETGFLCVALAVLELTL